MARSALCFSHQLRMWDAPNNWIGTKSKSDRRVGRKFPWTMVLGELAFWTLSQLSHYQNDTFTTVYFSCRKGILGGNFVASHFLRMLNISYLKLEQGCMIQWPAAFCLTLSWMSAFLDPKSFMASLLSVGWKMFWSWLRTQPGLESEENEKARLIKGQVC